MKNNTESKKMENIMFEENQKQIENNKGKQNRLPNINKQNQNNLIQLNKNVSSKTSKYRSQQKLNQSKFINYSQKKFIGYQNKSFLEVVSQRIMIKAKQEYHNMSNSQISKEYKDLKEELYNLNEALNKKISFRKQMQLIQKYRFHLQKNIIHNIQTFKNIQGTLNQNSKVYEKMQLNNSKIKQNKSTELIKLLKRSRFIEQNDPTKLKNKIKDEVIIVKEQLKQQKKGYKRLMLESDKLGQQILNTDKLVQQMRLLQNELQILTVRKKSLEDQLQINSQKSQSIQQKKKQFVDKESLLKIYQSEMKQKGNEKSKFQELQQQFRRKKRMFQALKKDKQANNNIKAKTYYDLLSSLNVMQRNSEEYEQKYQQLETKIEKSNHEENHFKMQYQTIVAKRKANKLEINNNLCQQKQQQDKVERTSFYQSKMQLDTNQKQSYEILKQVQCNIQTTSKNLKAFSKICLDAQSQERKINNDKQNSNNIQENLQNLEQNKQNRQCMQKKQRNHALNNDINQNLEEGNHFHQFAHSPIVQQQEQAIQMPQNIIQNALVQEEVEQQIA